MRRRGEHACGVSCRLAGAGAAGWVCKGTGVGQNRSTGSAAPPTHRQETIGSNCPGMLRELRIPRLLVQQRASPHLPLPPLPAHPAWARSALGSRPGGLNPPHGTQTIRTGEEAHGSGAGEGSLEAGCNMQLQPSIPGAGVGDSIQCSPGSIPQHPAASECSCGMQSSPVSSLSHLQLRHKCRQPRNALCRCRRPPLLLLLLSRLGVAVRCCSALVAPPVAVREG